MGQYVRCCVTMADGCEACERGHTLKNQHNRHKSWSERHRGTYTLSRAIHKIAYWLKSIIMTIHSLYTNLVNVNKWMRFVELSMFCWWWCCCCSFSWWCICVVISIKHTHSDISARHIAKNTLAFPAISISLDFVRFLPPKSNFDDTTRLIHNKLYAIANVCMRI